MRVLVTGSTGFLGQQVVLAAHRRGHTVRSLVREGTRVPADWPPDVDIVSGDLGDLTSLQAAVDGQDVVVHLAAMLGGGDADQFAVTVAGTERLVASLTGTSVQRVVLASSFSVYDWRLPRKVLDEDTPLDSQWWERDGYAASKIWQETVLREAASSAAWDLLVLRPGFIWGRDKPECSGVGQVVADVMIVIGWAGCLPLTYVDNCAEAFALAVSADVPDGTTVNIVDDDCVSARAYAAASSPVLGTRGRVVLPYPVARGMTTLAKLVSRSTFRYGGRLPSALEPRKFEARFRPLQFPNARAKHALGWWPRISWAEASRYSFDLEA